MSATTPDGIYGLENGDSGDPITESQTQAASIQAAFDKRQRFDYVWANTAARNAQTGMQQGSRGYQADIRTEYLYDNGAWRLALPYAEFTATSASFGTAGGQPVGVFNVDTATSTDTAFVTSDGSTSGVLFLTNPGIYAVYSLTNINTPTTSPGSMDLTNTATYSLASVIHRTQMPTSEILGGNVAPAIRTTTSNAPIGFWANIAHSNSSINTRVRIARIG